MLLCFKSIQQWLTIENWKQIVLTFQADIKFQNTVITKVITLGIREVTSSLFFPFSLSIVRLIFAFYHQSRFQTTPSRGFSALNSSGFTQICFFSINKGSISVIESQVFLFKVMKHFLLLVEKQEMLQWSIKTFWFRNEQHDRDTKSNVTMT